MSEKKDELIRVLTETVEVQKTVIRQLEDTAGYNEAKIRALEDEKERLKDNFILVFESNKKLVEENSKLKEENLHSLQRILTEQRKYKLWRRHLDDKIYDIERIIINYQNETFFQFLKRKLWS